MQLNLKQLSKSLRRLSGDAVWVLLLRFVRQALALAVVAVLVRELSVTSFAHYQFAITLLQVALLSQAPGLQRVIIQSVSRGFPGTFLEATRLAFRFSFLGAAGLGVAAGYFWVVQGDQSLGAVVAVAALLFPFANGLTQWQFYEIGRMQFRTNTIKISIGVIGSTSAVILLALAGVDNVAVLLFASLGVLAVQNVVQQKIVRSIVPPGAPSEPGAIAYAFKTWVWDGLNIVGNFIDRLSVSFFLSTEEFAIFAVADRIPEVVKINIQQVASIMVPRFSTRDRYTHELNRKLNIVAGAGLVGIALFALIVIPPLMHILYTDKYSEAVLLCQIILISVAIAFFSIIKKSFIDSQIDVASVRQIMLPASIIRIIGSVLLVWGFGLIGAAMSSLLYRLAIVLVTESVIRKNYLANSKGAGDDGSA